MTAILEPATAEVPSPLRRLIGISLSLVGTQAATSILGLAFWGLAARQFTVDAVGVAGVAVSAMTLLGTAGTVGLGTLLIARLPATPPAQRRVLVQTALLVAAVVTFLLSLVIPAATIHLFGAGNLRSIAGDPANALLFAAGTALMAVTIVLDQAVLTVGNGTLQLERNVIASAVKLIALVGLSLAGAHGGMTVFGAWAIGSIVSLPITALRSRRGDQAQGDGRRIDLSVMSGLGRAALGHHALNITLMVPLLLLPVIVTVVLSPRDNGIFTGALQITGFVFALPYAVSVALFAASAGDARTVIDRMRLTIPFGLGVSVLANAALFGLAPQILHLFGSVYATEGAVVLRLLVLAGLPFVIKDHFVALRRVQGRTGQATAVLAVLTVAEVIAAVTGAMTDGVLGLCLGWVLMLYAEIPILAVPLIRAGLGARTRAHDLRDPDTAAITPRIPAALVLDELDARDEAARLPEPLLPREGWSQDNAFPAEPTRGRHVALVLPPPPSSLPAAMGGGGHLVEPITNPINLDVLLRGPVARSRREGGGAPGSPSGLSVTDPFLRLPPEDQAPDAFRIGGITRADDPDEASFPAGSFRDQLVGPAIAIMAVGILNIGLAVNLVRGQQGAPGMAVALYVSGLALIFLPAATGVLLPGISSGYRVLLAVALPIALQLTRLVLYPTRFMFHDELLHANLLRIIDGGGRLFEPNPLLPITSYYPGLEVATNAVQDLTKLSPHVCAVIVLMAARVVLALAVLQVTRVVTGSARIGAAASVVYTTNPQMLFFNSQFSYQSLALPLAVLTVYLFLTRRQGSRRETLRGMLAPIAAAGGVVFTHHVTAGLLLLTLIVWSMLDLVVRRGSNSQAGPLAGLVAATAAFFAASLANPGNTLTSYLGSIALSSGQAVEKLAAGEQSKQAFKNSAGIGPQLWEQALIIASLGLTLVVLVPALWHARHWWRRRVTAAVLFTLTAMLYPLIPGGHLTVSTAEVGDRSAGFVFLGVGFVAGCWCWRRRPRDGLAIVFGAGATVAFIGGVVLGAGATSQQLPGPFQVSADARSIDGASIGAADWERLNLPADSVVYADRVGGLLAAAYGHQFTVRHISSGIDASRLLLDPEFTAADIALIRQAHIDYVIADRRDSFGLPNQQVYIESGEFGEAGRTAPVPLTALEKFDTVPGVSRIFDNGAVSVYDVRSLQDADPALGR